MAAVERLKPPPHSPTAERELIGALLLEPKAWVRVAGLVRAEDFYGGQHERLFRLIGERASAGKPTDPASLVDVLERSGKLDDVGGRDYLIALVEQSPSAVSIEGYARIIREHSTFRGLADVGQRIAALGLSPGGRSGEDALGDAARLLQGLNTQRRAGSGLVDAKQLAGELLDDLERRREGARGLSVGLPDFDRLSFGLEPGDLVVIAGRPGMGKTALLVSIAAHVSRSMGVAVFSAEMPAAQLMRRAVSLVGSVSQSSLRRAHELTEPDWQRVTEAACNVAERRLWIDDSSSPALSHIRAETMALAARAPLGLVLVDYAQLVKGEGANRYEQLRDVAYGLKGLAKELRAPVIALAQLNRGVEQRDNKRPRLSDLRDSGAIEEAADIVGMLYCEGYYDPSFGMPYVLECQVEKNRNGERGECLWHFAGEHSRVGTLEEAARHQYRRLRTQAQHRGGDDL